jgi:hypothetical protein
VPDVDSEYGMPCAAAARAIATSPLRQPSPTAPVGAIAIGVLDGAPRSAVRVSTRETSTSTFGTKRTRLNAARLSRSVASSSAPPPKKSNIARGSRRLASRRRSSIEYARATAPAAARATACAGARAT